jgi:hypothetical protein
MEQVVTKRYYDKYGVEIPGPRSPMFMRQGDAETSPCRHKVYYDKNGWSIPCPVIGCPDGNPFGFFKACGWLAWQIVRWRLWGKEPPTQEDDV